MSQADLLAVVLTIRPIADATVPGHLGRAVYAQILRWIDSVDPVLAQSIHDGDGPKPLTCSGLIGARRSAVDARQVGVDQTYFIRLTGLSMSVCQMMSGWLHTPPPPLDLDGVAFQIEQITADPSVDARAGSTTYESLVEQFFKGAPYPGRVSLRFLTPVAFRSQGMDMPLPLPGLLLGSLADRWNSFSPIAISPEMRQFAETQVALSAFSLQSRVLPYKDGGARKGAVGDAAYVARTSDRYWRAVLHLLAAYAFYSGAGALTTVGMGQIRLKEVTRGA